MHQTPQSRRPPPRGDQRASAEHPSAVLLRGFLEHVWAAGRLELVADLFHDDFVGYDPGHPPVVGRTALAMAIARARAAFADVVLLYDRFHVEEDRVGAAFTLRATHVASFRGIAPSKRAVDLGGTLILRVADGRFLRGWQSLDVADVARKAGAHARGVRPGRIETSWPAPGRPRLRAQIARLVHDGLSVAEIALHTRLGHETVRALAADRATGRALR